MNKTIGENIRILREKAGFTQSNLARYMGVDQSLISKVEKGERSLSADMIEKLSALFGVSIESCVAESSCASGRSCAPGRSGSELGSGNRTAAGTGLSFAFRGSEFSPAEMEAVAAVNRIALNSEFMHAILKEAGK